VNGEVLSKMSIPDGFRWLYWLLYKKLEAGGLVEESGGSSGVSGPELSVGSESEPSLWPLHRGTDEWFDVYWGRDCVVKAARDGTAGFRDGVINRLRWEADVLTQLNGADAPGVLTAVLIGVCEDGARPRLIYGGPPLPTLADAIAAGRIGDADKVDQVVDRVQATLTRARSVGIMHCDVTPENILVDLDGLGGAVTGVFLVGWGRSAKITVPADESDELRCTYWDSRAEGAATVKRRCDSDALNVVWKRAIDAVHLNAGAGAIPPPPPPPPPASATAAGAGLDTGTGAVTTPAAGAGTAAAGAGAGTADGADGTSDPKSRVRADRSPLVDLAVSELRLSITFVTKDCRYVPSCLNVRPIFPCHPRACSRSDGTG
jgi:hypothetical protein